MPLVFQWRIPNDTKLSNENLKLNAWGRVSPVTESVGSRRFAGFQRYRTGTMQTDSEG